MNSTLVRDAAAALVSLRPAYRDLIGFYAEIFALQEEALPQVALEPLRLEAREVKRRLEGRRPALPPPEMAFDAVMTRRLLDAICLLARKQNTALAEAAGILVGRTEMIARLGRALLDGDEGKVHRCASRLGTPPEHLSFFLLHSLRPSLMRNAARTSSLFPAELSWAKGYCPVCGNPLILAWIEADGRSRFVCRFCGHRWSGRRCSCPFCDTNDPARLSLRLSEEEPQCRLHLCEGCRSYGRLLSRPAYPELEHIASLHFDLLAARDGYRPPPNAAPK